MDKKKKHKKMLKLDYRELEAQKCIKDQSIPTHLKKLIFKYRTHMLDFKQNYKGLYKDFDCPLCEEHDDSQDMIEDCKVLKNKFPSLEDCKTLYKNDVDVKDAKRLEEVMEAREKENNSRS